MRNPPLINSTGSTEQQLLENGNFNPRRIGTTSVAQRISSLPPAYNDVILQNSVTIMMEEKSLQPPSYDDFIRKNSERV